MDNIREKAIEFFDHPTTGAGKAYAIFSIILIFLTVFQIVLETKTPDFVAGYLALFIALESSILFFFSLDLLLRIIFYKKKLKYLFSFYGLVDVIAVVPGIIGLFFPLAANASWVRVLRIVRIGRVLKSAGGSGFLSGFNGRLMPFIAAAIGFKALILVLEEYPWWPEIKNLGVVLGVVGFALAVLLGTKLRLVTSRMYSIEDAICRIVGALRLLRNNKSVKTAVDNWAQQFEDTIRNPTAESIHKIRIITDKLAAEFVTESLSGPNVAGFSRDVAYVLHRATARSPEAYEKFLKIVTFSYAGAIVFVVPGLTGFLTAILTVYTLVGMYMLIEDMDTSLDYSENSLVKADLDPIIQFNLKRET